MDKLNERINDYIDKINNDQIETMKDLGWSVDLKRSGFSQNCSTGESTFMPTFIMNINKDLEVYIRQEIVDSDIKWSLVARQLYDLELFREMETEPPGRRIMLQKTDERYLGDESNLGEDEYYEYDTTDEVYLAYESSLEWIMNLVNVLKQAK